jgi:acetate kinase
MEVFAHRVAREIAAAATNLARLDALVFTGEIGWDQPEARVDVCGRLALLGIESPIRFHVDADGPISRPGAAVPVLAVRPREELQLARETNALLG